VHRKLSIQGGIAQGEMVESRRIRSKHLYWACANWFL